MLVEYGRVRQNGSLWSLGKLESFEMCIGQGISSLRPTKSVLHRTYMEEGVLGATLDLAHPPLITGFEAVTSVKAPHLTSYVAFYRVINFI